MADLTPSASPTNQFLVPSIGPPPDPRNNTLASLAASLARVAPELQDTFARKFQVHVENSQAQANADFLQKRFENTKALKAAVDRGEIAQADNPWYMVQLRQDQAANDAVDSVRQMQTDWETSPVRFSDDPKQVETWAKQQLAGTIDGRDAYESEAMAPVLQGGVNQLLGQHTAVRRSEREADRIANFQQRVSTALTSPDAPQHLQALINDARMTMPGAQVNALVVRAAQEAAEAGGDESVLSALSSVPNAGAGGTLADFPEIKKLQADLPMLRMQRSLKIEAEIEQQQKREQEQRKDAAIAGLMQAGGGDPAKVRITPEMAQRLNIPFKDVIEVNEAAIRYGETVAEQGDKRAALVDKGNARAAKALQGQVQSELAAGRIKLTDPEVMDAVSRLSVLDPDSANQFNRFLSDFQDLSRQGERLYARESDPQTYAALWDLAKVGKLDSATLIPQAQKLSHEDWTRLFHETIKTDSSTKLSDFPMGKYDDLLKDMVAYPKSLSFAGSPDAMAMAAKDDATAGQIVRAQTKFAETVQQYLNDPAFTKLSRPEQTTKIRQALDATAQEFGGVTDDKRRAVAEEQQKKSEQAQQQAQAAMTKTVTFANGQGMTPDGKPFGTPTALSDEVRGQVRQVSAALDVATGDAPRSLERIYADKTTRTWWQTLTFQNPADLRNRDEAVLSAYVHNSRLLNSGSFGPNPAQRVTDSLASPQVLPDTHSDVQTSARLNAMQQRKELAAVRRRIGEQWINDTRRDELVKLTAEMSGPNAFVQPVSPDKVRRFRDLAENFRLYDFLGVTAGVDRDDVERDYRVLYKYPAAASVEEFKRMGSFLTRFVPREEFAKVQEAQRSLIDNANDLLLSGRYVP